VTALDRYPEGKFVDLAKARLENDEPSAEDLAIEVDDDCTGLWLVLRVEYIQRRTPRRIDSVKIVSLAAGRTSRQRLSENSAL
jgi:hypothetical protein